MSDTALGFALFDTAIGPCSIVWNARGVVRTRLPEGGERAARDRIGKRYPAARETSPPAEIKRAIDDMVALLKGEPRDLTGVKLDIAGRAGLQLQGLRHRAHHSGRLDPDLWRDCRAARRPHLARDVGQALGQNPFPIIVPCHRVTGGRRQDRRLLGARRRQHQNAHAHHRAGATGRQCAERSIGSVRSIAAGSPRSAQSRKSAFTTPFASLISASTPAGA